MGPDSANTATAHALDTIASFGLQDRAERATPAAAEHPSMHHSHRHANNGLAVPSLTQLAAQHLERIRNSKLTSEVRDKTVLCLLDYLGALISGLSTPWASALLKYAGASSGGACGLPTSSQGAVNVMGLGSHCSAEQAAFTNASIAHSIIRDDMHLAAGAHIGVMVIPAALALAQRDHWSGEQLLKAIVGGYEMAAVLGSAVRHSGLCNPHFRPSGIIGSFAAAATGIVADPTMTRAHAAHALGLAANMSAGLNEWPWAGGLEIQTHMGTATRAGVTSYDLARAGMSSSETVLEGKDGLFVAYGCGDRDVAATAFRSWLVEAASNEALGFGTGIMGTKFKPVAGCNFIQTPVSVALQIHTNLQPNITATTENIEWVTIVTTSPARAYPGCDNGGPFQKEQQTKMSLQYGVSAALLFGRVDEGMYVQFSNAGLQKLIQECVLETDPMYDEKLFKRGKQPCRIEVRMKDGHIHRASMDDVPWLEGQAVEERFRREAAAVFDPAVATTSDIVDQIVLECQRLEGASSTDRLCDLLASAAVEGPLDER